MSTSSTIVIKVQGQKNLNTKYKIQIKKIQNDHSQLGEEFDEKTADMRDVRTLAVFEGGKLVTLEKASSQPSSS